MMFSPRLLRPEERALVAEWLASAGDVASAYVSSRQGDDPATYRRIVVTVEKDEEPSYLIGTAEDAGLWIVQPYQPQQRIVAFGSLRGALNSIRRVLPGSRTDDAAEMLARWKRLISR
jgi:hypothetical protein